MDRPSHAAGRASVLIGEPITYALLDAVLLAELALFDVGDACEAAEAWRPTDPMLSACPALYAVAALAWARSLHFVGPCGPARQEGSDRLAGLAASLAARSRGPLEALAVALHGQFADFELAPLASRAQKLLASPPAGCSPERAQQLIEEHGAEACAALAASDLSPAELAEQLGGTVRFRAFRTRTQGDGRPELAEIAALCRAAPAAGPVRAAAFAALERSEARWRGRLGRVRWAGPAAALGLVGFVLGWNVAIGIRFGRG